MGTVPVLAFDIETVPDVAGIRRLYELPAELPDREVAEIAFQRRRTQTGSDFLGPQLQRVAVISCVLRDADGIKVFSIGAPDTSEKEAIQRFFDGVEKLVPQLVSWNGGGFDLPVLHHRSLIHGVTAPRYWDWGDGDRDFRSNNYLNRFHTRHLDLMDVLASFQARACAGLDAMARLCGFPGKLGFDGSEVHAAYQAGRIDDIRRYCETDVLNTHLLYLRFQQLRGTMSAGQYAAEVSLAREKIAVSTEPHWCEFIAAWDAAGG